MEEATYLLGKPFVRSFVVSRNIATPSDASAPKDKRKTIYTVRPQPKDLQVRRKPIGSVNADLTAKLEARRLARLARIAAEEGNGAVPAAAKMSKKSKKTAAVKTEDKKKKSKKSKRDGEPSTPGRAAKKHKS